MNNQAQKPSNPLDLAGSLDQVADSELVERLKLGDAEAFRVVYMRYKGKAYSLAFGVVRNRDDAAEITQEAFLRVHRNIQAFQGQSSFYTWFYRIVMNLSIDHQRKARGHATYELDDSLDLSSKEGALTSRGQAPASPLAELNNKELRGLINEALAHLPELHRAAVILREIEELSYEEIAEVLGVPVGTVMSRLFYARKRLQALLEPYGSNAGAVQPVEVPGVNERAASKRGAGHDAE